MILSDNGTPFINYHVEGLLDEYMVDHRTSSTYYPQGNGQAEATNKTLIRILSKLLDECGGTWADHLPVAPWAYRTFKRKSTRASPFNLVYGVETILPAELSVPSARMILAMENSAGGRRADFEALEERRVAAAVAHEKYWEFVTRYYNKGVVPRVFKVGDLVWKATVAIKKDLKTPKFTPRWEGPYEVIGASESGYYHLACVEDGFWTGAVNSKYFKKFYP
ncbi:hypothetical protein RHGRI_007890 [Rhododendron griersonianum]|uniref:Integrase catalytic domain-containing protein n=1 Tax=Rhododendron griersonianum TaxID=479676 RepID=A0AAV6KYF8_9ERIC|nr:hypothetical protein RHGRI_007890 [Rhododendron griersonianum]